MFKMGILSDLYPCNYNHAGWALQQGKYLYLMV